MIQGSINIAIKKALGDGFPRSFVTSSLILSVMIFFYIYTIASYLNLRVYPFIDRITYYANFQVYIINEFVDHIILCSFLAAWLALSLKHPKIRYISLGLVIAWLVIGSIVKDDNPIFLNILALSSIPAIVTLIAYDRNSVRPILINQNRTLILNHLALIGIITGTITLAAALVHMASGSNSAHLNMRAYAYEVFLIFSSYSPILVLFLATSFPIRLLVRHIYEIIFKTSLYDFIIESYDFGAKRRLIFLSFIIMLSILIVLIPHLSTINGNRQLVSVDTSVYVTWMEQLRQSDNLTDFLSKVFVEQSDGDRPFSLMFYLAIYTITNADPSAVIEYSAFLLAPALAITVFFFTRELTSNDLTSIIAAFLTSISFQPLIGVYAGFYSNWIATILAYLAFIFLFRFLNKGNRESLLLFGILSFFTLFSHAYTWTLLAIVAVIFLMTFVIRKSEVKRRNAAVLLIAVLFVIGIDLSKSTLLGASGGIDKDLELSSRFVGIEQFLYRWNNINYAVTTYVGGLFSNFIVFSLGIYWLLFARQHGMQYRFIMIFLSIGIMPFLIGGYVIQARVLYEIPFQIPAAIALTNISRQSPIRLRSLPIYIWLIAMSFISISNYHLIVH